MLSSQAVVSPHAAAPGPTPVHQDTNYARSPFSIPTPRTPSMLITQPSIMWMHGGVIMRVADVCCWLSTVFPKVLASSLLTWAQYGVVVHLWRHFGRPTTMFIVLAFPVSALYVLSVYTYFKVIYVGAGSPLDFPELARDHRVQMAPSDPYASPGNDPPNPPNPAKDGPKDAPKDAPSHVPNDGPLALDQSNPAEDCEGSPLAPNAGSRYPPSEFLVSHSFRNNEPAYRWCGTCMVWKPDRCHHCSTCRKCFLRMDHHCPWFACCIGFKNHKFFIQSLLYITAFSGAVCGVSSFLLYTFFADAQYDHGVYLSLNLVFLFVVSVAFFCAVGCFAAFSVYLVLRNYTTIEFQDEKWSGSERNQYEYDAAGQRKNLRHLYDLGYAKNWRSIMGSSWLHWLLPVSVTDSTSVYSSTNGLNFDVQEDVFQKYCYNARLQAQLNAQLAEYRDRSRGITGQEPAKG